MTVAVKAPAPSRIVVPAAPAVIEPLGPEPTTTNVVPSGGTGVDGIVSVD